MARKILIVDDIPLNRQILKSVLNKDYDIIEAENGKVAMYEIHRRYKMLSAILLDIMMPVMDGYEVMRQMKDNAALAQIPVIVITASDDEQTRVKALSMGANDFITKPYNQEIIKHCLRNNIALRETASIVNAIKHDKLTGLYTREAFFEKANGLLSDREPGYYIMSCFDINNFKNINEQYGANEGDKILRFIGKNVAESMSMMGGIGCRIAADNFAALYPASEDVYNFIEHMQSLVTTPEPLQSSTVFSTGKYIVNDLSLSVAALYDRAYLAKQSIKGRYDVHVAYFDEIMRSKLVLEQQIIAEMDLALSKHQFEAWFQPQYNHSTGALIGAEALVRWRHPVKGLISPTVFIPVFEQNGFVYELDKYIWEQVCRYLRKWIDSGYNPLPVSVNISRYDIFRADLTDYIIGLMKKYDIPVDLLRLEITESAFAKSSEQIIYIVKNLLNYGFTVEIDDFGSGYSSLNTLKDVPAQVLKLDMRFLESKENSQRGGNILESVVRMAKWLDMAVIAEGVEIISQANFLKSIGCDYVQGYLYAKAMPPDEYETLFLNIGKEERLLSLETVENLDNNSFWDPNSLDTLIFNTYIGGACILEYCNGKTELLRVNDKYIKELTGSSLDKNIYNISIIDFIDDDNIAILNESIDKAIHTGEEATDEIYINKLFGNENKIFVRITVRIIARTGARYLVYCTITNTTAQREAEFKERRITEQMRAIMNDIDSGITASVIVSGSSDGGDDIDGDVTFLFSNDKYYEILGYTREQYEAEVPRIYSVIHPDDRENVREAIINSYLTGAPAQLEYRIIRRNGNERWVRSGLSSTRFTGVDENVQLRTFTDITTEKRAELELRDTSSLLQTLMNDTPGGFLRLYVGKDGILSPIYYNDGFKKLIDLSSLSGDSGSELRSYDIFSNIHPDDVGIVNEALDSILSGGEAQSSVFRIRYGNDDNVCEYIHVMIFGRATKNASDERFLNIYYIDAEEQSRNEEQQKKLLDNLPCGAALFGFDGVNLSIIHLNKRCRELSGRIADEHIIASALNAVHPDERDIVKNELLSAIKENRDASCDIKIKDDEGNYNPFHVVARVIPQGNSHYYICATYMPM